MILYLHGFTGDGTPPDFEDYPRTVYRQAIVHDTGNEGLLDEMEYWMLAMECDISTDKEANQIVARIRKKRSAGYKPACVMGYYYRIEKKEMQQQLFD